MYCASPTSSSFKDEGDVSQSIKIESTDKRIFVISKAMRAGYSVDQIHELTKIDRWFLQKLMNIVRTAQELETLDESVTQIKSDKKAGAELIRRAKIQGFSDFQIARAIWKDKMEDCHMQWVREYRKSLGIVPVVKQIDTLAAEYPAQTNYLYLTYSGIANDVKYLGDKKSIVVLCSTLGLHTNRIPPRNLYGKRLIPIRQ